MKTVLVRNNRPFIFWCKDCGKQMNFSIIATYPGTYCFKCECGRHLDMNEWDYKIKVESLLYDVVEVKN